MSKYQLKSSARELRRNGVSIIKISKELNVSKSTISIWCRDIDLNEEQFEILRKNKGVSLTTGQRNGAEANKRKRLTAIQEAESLGMKIVGRISKRELLLIATALYWCEGSKSDRTSGFIFINSDPKMILTMKKFLVEVLDTKIAEIVCSVQINMSHKHRIDTVLKFWKNLLKLPMNQFRKPYYVKTTTKKVYDNHDNYFGVCRLIVRKGMNLKYRMLGLIKAIDVSDMSA